MPLKVNELIIQAKFEEDELSSTGQTASESFDMELYKEEILRECMEKMEEYLRKQETR